jgi:hypothetical protein
MARGSEPNGDEFQNMNESPQAPILTSLRLLKARNLARRGKMRAAQALLGAEGSVPENLVELHMLAALVTSEGDYPRALHLWRMLLNLDPRHAEARRMIAAIELWLSRPPWVRYVPAGVVALLVVIVVAVVALAVDNPPPAAKTAPMPPASAVSPAAPPRAVTVPSSNRRRSGQ